MTDIVPIVEDDLAARSREEVEEAARRWYTTALDMRGIQDQLVEDLESALNMCRSYQGILARLQLNDPNLVKARSLLTKYKMDHTQTSPPTRVFVDGVDITDYPDSIEGEVLPVLELTSEEYYGTQIVELIKTEDGEFHMVPKGEEIAPETEWEEPPVIPTKRPLPIITRMARWLHP